MQKTGLCWIYAELAAAGAAATWYFNILFMLEGGGSFDIISFIRGGILRMNHRVALDH